jgi:hypothetical protein
VFDPYPLYAVTVFPTETYLREFILGDIISGVFGYLRSLPCPHTHAP